MKAVWLYGAGDVGKKTQKLLSDFGINIDGYIETDEEKNGLFVCGKPVISYKKYIEEYKNEVYVVITPVMHIEEIWNQLLKDGTEKENLVTKEYLIRKMWKLNWDDFVEVKNKKHRWIIDTGEWGSFGGVEKYTYVLAEALLEGQENVDIIFPSEIKLVPEKLKKDCINFNFYLKSGDKIQTGIYFSNMKDYESIDFREKMIQAISILYERKPFTLIARNSGLWYVAAAIIKDRFPQEIRLINVIHGYDFRSRYELHCTINDFTKVVCSNSGIKRKLLDEDIVEPEKIVVKRHPILPRGNLCNRQITAIDKRKVRLGYAGRIDVIDKRSDLMIPFWDKLFERTQNFQFYIAGDGPYLSELKSRLSKKEYKDLIIFVGKLPYGKVYSFWDEMDIFLNFSDTEGFCLSMIEAMQCGKACISTKVHEDIGIYIRDDVNGYVVPVGDLDVMVEKVVELINYPEKIRKFGENSREIIHSLEGTEEYVHFLKEFV